MTNSRSFLERLLDAIFGRNRPTPPPVPPPTPVPTPTPTPEPVPPPNGTASWLLSAHNQIRASKGLKPLAGNPRLQAAAQGHADFMAKRGKMAHSGIGDGSPWDRIEATGYRYATASENVAWNQRDVATVMSDWMNSSGHRAAILGRYSEFGGAAASGGNGLYWCAVFATPGVASLQMASVAIVASAPVECEGGWLIPAATSEGSGA